MISFKKKKQILHRVQRYATVMDKYGVEAILSLFPVLGDGGMTLISTCYYLYEANQMGLSQSEITTLLFYQAKDFIVGIIPVIGDIADFFYLGNVYATKIFENHVAHSIKQPIPTALESEYTVL